MPGPTPCTRCGAPLPETDGARVCATCGHFHEARPDLGKRAGSGAPGQGAASRGGSERPKQAQMSSRAARAKGGGVVGLVLAFTIGVPILVLVVVVMALVFGSSGSDVSIEGVEGTDLSPTTGDLLVLPGALDDSPSVVTMANEIGADRRVVALVELEEGPVWEAEIVPEDVYSAQFAATDDVVLASLGRGVVGLDRDTGDVLWEGEASDVVSPFCTACFAVVDGTLVVLGDDGYVTAFDPADGAVRWEHRFASPSGKVVPVGDAVLLVDESPEDDPDAAVSMALVRPSDGSELSRFAPRCLDDADYPTWGSPDLPVIPVPGTDDVVITYGSPRACVQRWTVTSGEQRWSRRIEGSLDWHGGDDRPWALGSTELVLAGAQQWAVVGLAEGGVRIVPVPEDTQAGPMVVIDGDRFVGTASSTRGSTEWSLVAHELRTGDPLWTRELGPDVEPAEVGPESTSDSVYDGAIFALAPVGDELRLLTIGPPGPRFAVSGIDPDSGGGDVDGVAPIRAERPETVSARIDTVRDGQALVDADGVLQVVDLATGEVGAAWGR